MGTYTPHRWLVVKITSNEGKSHYRVFASWYGGYLGADSWKLNSGITKVKFEDERYHFDGSSGSVYVCHKDTKGLSVYGLSVLDGMMRDSAERGTVIEILPDDTNLLELNYEQAD